MKLSTGRWVSGDDFFNRKEELAVLESRVRDRNHLVMTGQRRMGKTSILQELGRRLELEGWVFLFADVEADRSEEDMIASLAKAIHPVTPIASRFLRATGRRFQRLAGRWTRSPHISLPSDSVVAWTPGTGGVMGRT